MPTLRGCVYQVVFTMICLEKKFALKANLYYVITVLLKRDVLSQIGEFSSEVGNRQLIFW